MTTTMLPAEVVELTNHIAELKDTALLDGLIVVRTHIAHYKFFSDEYNNARCLEDILRKEILRRMAKGE